MSGLNQRDESVSVDGFTRRRLFRLAGLLGLGSLLPGVRGAEGAQATKAAKTAAPAVKAASAWSSGIYESIGVKPLINCRGTLTIIGGSIELPEVREAKSKANQQHVQLDELMDAVGQRLATATGAEWGMVTAGCAAAISHATAACVAGGNPELHVRIPDLRGFPKDEVIIPSHSRNVYDAAVRATGVKIIEPNTPEELRLAIGPKTAMIYVFANNRNETGPMSLEAIAAIAKPFNIPIMVDAAAEVLTVPSIHLQRGASLVGYSGGKIIRGPQSAGL
jgi:L-seryl-tRNA(Ser) seleniumtransferase